MSWEVLFITQQALEPLGSWHHMGYSSRWLTGRCCLGAVRIASSLGCTGQVITASTLFPDDFGRIAFFIPNEAVAVRSMLDEYVVSLSQLETLLASYNISQVPHLLYTLTASDL